MRFLPGRKRFEALPTPEQQYADSGSYAATAVASQQAMDARNARYRQQQREETKRKAWEVKRRQVLQAGTLRRVGTTLFLEGGWRFATDALPVGELGGLVVHGNKVGDLTAHDLHALAVGHGPTCRCGIV